MTIIQVPANTELRSMPFARKSGYSPFRSIMDSAGRVQNQSVFGDAQAENRNHDISINFSHGYFDDELKINLTGGGTFNNINPIVSADANAAGDVVTVMTRDLLEYSAGNETQIIFNGKFTSDQSAAVVRQYLGCSDFVNGFLVGALNGSLTVNVLKNSIFSDEISQIDFNLDKLNGSGVSGFLIDITKLNTFRIQYGYMGSMPTIFEIFGGSKLGWIPIHAFDQTNSLDSPIIDNPILPFLIHSEVVSGVPSAPISVGISTIYAGTIGSRIEARNASKFATLNEIRITGGDPEKPIIGIRVKSIFRTLPNIISISLLSMDVLSRGNQESYFEIWANSTIPDGAWIDVDTDNSVVEVALNEFNFSGGRFIGALLLTNRGNEDRQFQIGEVAVRAGENIIIIARSDASSDVGASLRWGEMR